MAARLVRISGDPVTVPAGRARIRSLVAGPYDPLRTNLVLASALSDALAMHAPEIFGEWIEPDGSVSAWADGDVPREVTTARAIGSVELADVLAWEGDARSWAVCKADTLVAAWRDTTGLTPSKQAAMIALAVAIHETGAGDAWPGEHNWGAVQKRKLTDDERRALEAHGVAPTRANRDLAASLLPYASDEALHWDSDPSLVSPSNPSGGFFVWFWRFPNDYQGARTFISALVVSRPTVAASLVAGDVASAAHAMYCTGYYGGVHPTGRPRSQRCAPPMTSGELANVADYTSGIYHALGGITGALASWKPSNAPPCNWEPNAPRAGALALLAVLVGAIAWASWHVTASLVS
jgi:hypothetical protein